MGRGRLSARIAGAGARRNPGGASRKGSSNTYGRLVRTYPSGTKSYEKNVTLQSGKLDEDQRIEVSSLMSNVVRHDIRDALEAAGVPNPNRADIDLENDTVTVWVNVSKEASPSGLAKAYYKIDYDFQIDTDVKPTGKVKRFNNYKGVKLRLAGVNPY